MDENREEIIEICDEQTGEKFQFVLADGFEYKDDKYYVFYPVEEEEEDVLELLIMKEVADENGEIMLESIGDDEEDEIYSYYDELSADTLDDILDDEDDSEEE